MKTICLCAGGNRVYVSVNNKRNHGYYPTPASVSSGGYIEALAQVGAVCILSCEKFKGKTAYFGGINNCRFKKKVVPGDVLMLETELIKQKGPVAIARAAATVDGKVAATAELTVAIG